MAKKWRAFVFFAPGLARVASRGYDSFRGNAMKPAAKKSKKDTQRQGTPTAAQVLDAALEIAEETGWDALRLRQVAAALNCPLSALLAHYRDLDAVANAWFGRAGAAMLAPVAADFYDQPGPDRLHSVIMRWFDALAPHRRISVDMLQGKLYASHPHHWVPMIFDLSRTVHWIRDMAGLDATGRRRQLEEIGLTGVFLATLAVWSRDASEGQERTRCFLRKALRRSDQLLGRLPGRRNKSSG